MSMASTHYPSKTNQDKPRKLRNHLNHTICKRQRGKEVGEMGEKYSTMTKVASKMNKERKQGLGPATSKAKKVKCTNVG